MKTMLRKVVFLLVIVLLFTPSCTFPSPAAQPTQGFTPTLLGAATLTPSATMPGDATLTPSPTPLGGSTLTPSATMPGDPSFTPSVTLPSVPQVTALKNANCRYGPGTAYDIADTLFAGKTAPLVGRNELSTWWQIKGPTFGSLCWVSQVTVEVNGSMDGVPIGVAPPPPTLTPEPRPQKPKGCYVNDVSGKPICTVPCPADAVPGGACKP